MTNLGSAARALVIGALVLWPLSATAQRLEPGRFERARATVAPEAAPVLLPRSEPCEVRLAPFVAGGAVAGALASFFLVIAVSPVLVLSGGEAKGVFNGAAIGGAVVGAALGYRAWRRDCRLSAGSP